MCVCACCVFVCLWVLFNCFSGFVFLFYYFSVLSVCVCVARVCVFCFVWFVSDIFVVCKLIFLRARFLALFVLFVDVCVWCCVCVLRMYVFCVGVLRFCGCV